MTPQEVYRLPVLYEADDLSAMFGTYSHWKDIDDWVASTVRHLSHPRITIKVHGESWGDPRRFWRLASVWLDDDPVAICRNAGREGDDSTDQWITNREKFGQLVAELMRLYVGTKAIGSTAMDEDIGDVCSWYGEQVWPGKKMNLGWGFPPMPMHQ